MKKAEQITRGILALFLIVGCYLFLHRRQIFSAQAVLFRFNEPAIKTGGLIFTDKKQKKPEPGDVMMYRLRDSLVTHRVIRRRTACMLPGETQMRRRILIFHPDWIEREL